MLKIFEEKKVEYLELIYDLIFVYIIGRNNSLLHHIEDGFVSWSVFLVYVLCMLAIIQIWNFSTFYINLYGRNGVRDHIFILINMYLLYHMADGINTAWQSSFDQFNVAWLLILVNIGVQHIIEMRNHEHEPWVLTMLKRKAIIIIAEAVLIGAHMLAYHLTGISFAYVPILFGIIATALSGKVNMLMPVDFTHLTERAMLYVVFTFGEMVISIAAYFAGDVTLNSLYFSLMAFLIVVALFLCYEMMYNKIIDREKNTNGTAYMLLHLFMIFALNNISVSLEFMREEEVAILPKTLFISISLILYFVCLFLTGMYAKKRCAFDRLFIIPIIATGIVFVLLMFLFRNNMYLNIIITAIFAFGIFLMIYRRGKMADQCAKETLWR